MFTHIVQSGDTLWSIANKYRLYPTADAINKIIVENKLWRMQYIAPGQALRIPIEGLYYRVGKGDTLWDISRRFNISVNQLTSLNHITNPSALTIGQLINFPKSTFDPGKYLICIDPGHQIKPNTGTEPLAPGSIILKQKVSAGTQGIATGKPEYVLNLEVAQKSEQILRLMGYNVLMTRSIHDVDISNAERALMANRAGADLCVRLHADGDFNKATKGISVLYPAEDSPNTNAEKYEKSKGLAQKLLEELIASTKSPSRGISPRTDITGFNWSDIPVALVEMGFMSNAEEDKKMSTIDYQYKLAEGIAGGIQQYLLIP